MPSLQDLLEQNQFTAEEIRFALQAEKVVCQINNDHKDWEQKRGATREEIKAEFAKIGIVYPNGFVSETLNKLCKTTLRTGEPCAVLCYAGGKWYSVTVCQ